MKSGCLTIACHVALGMVGCGGGTGEGSVTPNEAPSPVAEGASTRGDLQNPTVRRDCSIALFPFDLGSEPVYGENAEEFVNVLAGYHVGRPAIHGLALSQEACIERVDRHAKQLDGTDVLEGMYKGFVGVQKKARVPRAVHEPVFIDRSVEDGDFLYRSHVFAFEFTIMSDGLKNLKLDEVQCTVPVGSSFKGDTSDLLDCDGYVPQLYGGTKIEKRQQSQGLVITLRFGVDSNGQYCHNPGQDSNGGIGFVPWTLGANPSLASKVKAFQPSAPPLSEETSPYRRFSPRFSMTTKGSDAKIWTVTTTSRVLARTYKVSKQLANDQQDFPLLINTFCKAADSPHTGWCPTTNTHGLDELTVQLVDGSGRNHFYWMDAAIASSVWYKP